jgi:hypothetical protein
MCGSEQNWVVGGLIVAAAMLVSAFASQGDTAGAHRQQHKPPAHSQSAGSDLMVSLDPLTLSVRSGNFTLEVTV